MPLPPGVETRTIVVYPGFWLLRNKPSVEIIIEPSENVLVWTESSQPIILAFDVIRTAYNEPATLVLPTVDQDGFVDDLGLPVTGWYYRIKVRYLEAGRKLGIGMEKLVQPTSDDPLVRSFSDTPGIGFPEGSPE